MLETINPQSNVAVFAQIENEVRFAIASGQLKPGDKLPAVRAVAERLDLNPNTVAKAYRDLEIMGLVYSRRGTGIFIREGAAAACRAACYREILGKMHEAVAEARAAGLTAAEIQRIAKACYAASDSPYAPPASPIRALAAGRTRG